MIHEVLARRLEQYAPASALDQENALVEIVQRYVLAGLARAGLFKVAQFHGGTFLRVFQGLGRFSEDLDFVLKEGQGSFSWDGYLDRTVRYLADEGLSFEVVDRSAAGAAVQKAFLKTDAIGSTIILALPHPRHPRRRIKIKIDVVPPQGSTFETSYLDFPQLTAVTTQTLGSAFASKSHALLCRSYVKGRDWYDFLWYAAKDLAPNLTLLHNAVRQAGSWAGKDVRVTPGWYLGALRARVSEIDWKVAAADVRRFLPASEQESLDLWDEGLFNFYIDRLGGTFEGRGRGETMSSLLS